MKSKQMFRSAIHGTLVVLAAMTTVVVSCDRARAISTEHKRMVAGQTIEVAGITSSANCATSNPGSIEVLSAPHGGSISQRLVRRLGPRMAGPGQPNPCAGVMQTFQMLYYTARSNFSGEDRVMVRIHNPFGLSWDHLHIMSVEPRPQKPAAVASAKQEQNSGDGSTTPTGVAPGALSTATVPNTDDFNEAVDKPAAAPGTSSGEGGSTSPMTKLTFNGTCQSLVVDGEDSTASCSPVMETISSSPANEKTLRAISFNTSGGTTIIFAGEDGRLEKGTLKQPISYVRLTISSGDSPLIEATGSCVFPDPSTPVVVQCEARTANSTYAARFLTDGNQAAASKIVDSPKGAPTTTLTFHGTCQNLIIDGDDRTVDCAPALFNISTLHSPAAVIGFATRDGSIGFHGNEQGQIENGSLRQPINRIELNKGEAQQYIKANGFCLFPNPSTSVVVQCEARTTNSTYAVRFLTDGTKPTATTKIATEK